MPSSDVLLNVLAADQTSEVIVVDSDFRVLARGIQGVQLQVPPGIYRAKLRVGDQQSDKLFSVEVNEPNNLKIVQLDALEFSSPIPLQKTSTSREFHQGAICNATAAGAATAQLGQGAEILVFLRDPSLVYFELKPDETETYRKNFEGFVLSNLDGSDPHPLETIGLLDATHGYLIASATVNPGTYILSRVSSEHERLCLPLVVPAAWSLQVFVTMSPAGDSAIARLADFDGAAMVLDKPNTTFSPDRPDLRVLEVARQALARGRNVVDNYSLAELLSGKYQNPMMGLLAAHLLLLAKTPDLTLAEKVITNTGNLIGADYPDLLVLSWKLTQLRGAANTVNPPDTAGAESLIDAMKAPPMLQLSWHYFMEAYRSLGGKAVLDARLSKMASQLLSSSVWVSWLESADYPSAIRDMIAEVAAVDSAAAPPVRLSEVFSPAPSFPTRLPDIQATSKSMGGAPGLGAGDIAKTLWLGTAYVAKKLSGLLGSKKRRLTLEQAPAAPPQATASEYEELRHALLAKAGHIGAHLAAHYFKVLVEHFDWKEVVGHLKSVSLLGGKARPLTPLQRQLLLSFKAAREQFDDEGTLSEEAIAHWLTIPDVPTQSVLDDLTMLYLIAASFDEKKPVPASIAKAIVRTGDE